MLLVVNAGSSSIKLAVFDGLVEVMLGRVSDIGPAARLQLGHVDSLAALTDHAAALDALFATMAGQGFSAAQLTAAAHRVVHGGADLVQACRITPARLAQIVACVPLAPLHNPANLTAILAMQQRHPEMPQYACFDTAFHATNPAEAVSYALPAADRALGLRRYGFHGLSYAGLVDRLRQRYQTLPKRLLALHLGNGASLCAILDGVSVATTMGYSPLDGLTMGTRAGAIDGNAVLRLAQLHGIDGASRILNHESGLLALGGSNDMRALHGAGTKAARFAVQHFCYWAVRHAGSMIAAMGGLDAVAFTGGIGENDAVVRAAILQGLHWTGLAFDAAGNTAGRANLHLPHSAVAAYIVPATEERQIAQQVNALQAQGL